MSRTRAHPRSWCSISVLSAVAAEHSRKRPKISRIETIPARIDVALFSFH